MSKNLPPIKPDTLWQHTSGRVYTVLTVANEHAQRTDDYPLMVVYQGQDGRVWSRLASDWHRSMSALDKVADEHSRAKTVSVAVLAQALNALEEARDDVTDAMANAEALRGYPRTDRRYQAYLEQLQRHDDAIGELRKLLAS